MRTHKNPTTGLPRALIQQPEQRRTSIEFILRAALIVLFLFSLSACKKSPPARSSSLRSADCCAAYQHSDSLPEQSPQNVTRLAIGGDARDDRSGVLPWALGEAKRRGAKAFFFLGDLELTRSLDKLTARQLAALNGLPFYPLMGNHEVEFLGILRLPDSEHAVNEFKEDFLKSPGLKLAPLKYVVAYSVDLPGDVHWIAMDNVSRKGEGFGPEQLSWLAADLQAASTAKKIIFVGMHKGLANNPVTTHAMDEDGPSAVADSNSALALFKQYKVAAVFVSHSHMYAAYDQEGIPVRLTGGLGAPLVKGLSDMNGGLHHFLLVDVPNPSSNQSLPQIEVVKFRGKSVQDEDDEVNEKER